MNQRESALRLPAVAVLLLLFLFGGVIAPAAAGELAVAPSAELITDGGFESGGTGWTKYSSVSHPVVTNFYPLHGSQSAELGGTNNTEDRITQKITIPTGKSARLTFWWALRTEEAGTAFDTFKVNLLDANGVLIKTLVALDNSVLEPYAWDLRSFDLSAYAGQTVQVQFAGKTDPSNITSFYVDDVSVQTGAPWRKTFLPQVRR